MKKDSIKQVKVSRIRPDCSSIAQFPNGNYEARNLKLEDESAKR